MAARASGGAGRGLIWPRGANGAARAGTSKRRPANGRGPPAGRVMSAGAVYGRYNRGPLPAAALRAGSGGTAALPLLRAVPCRAGRVPRGGEVR